MLILALPALAVEFSTRTIPLGFTAAQITSVTAEDGDSVVILGADGAWATYGAFPAPGFEATAIAGGDGMLWVCDSTSVGVWSGVGDPVRWTQSCAGLAARDDRALVVGDGLSVMTSEGGESVSDATPDLLGLAPSTTSGAPVAWASTGSATLSQLDDFGESSLAVGGPLAALAWGASNWVVATDTEVFELRTTERYSLSSVIAVGRADFGGMGNPTLWAFDGQTLTVLDTVLSGHPIQADRVVVADTDNDGCGEVYGIVGENLTVLTVTDCGVDSDGDGVRTGDCAPDDATIYPGAVELCDGVDQDCDGVSDEAQTLSVPSVTGTEGTVFGFEAVTDGCPADAGFWDWQFMGEADCSATQSTAACLALDDASVSVTITLETAEGLILTAESSAEVANQPPYVLYSAVDWGDHPEGAQRRFDVEPDEAYTVQLVAGDAGADTFVWELLTNGMPVSLSEDGFLQLSGLSSGEYSFEYRVTDDDGGYSDHTFEVATAEERGENTDEENDGGLCCSLGSLASGAVGVFFWRGRKRRL